MKACIEHTGGYVVQASAALALRGGWGSEGFLVARARDSMRVSCRLRAARLLLPLQTDTFTNPIFKDSLRRLFTPAGEEGYLGLNSNATFEVHCRQAGRQGRGGRSWAGLGRRGCGSGGIQRRVAGWPRRDLCSAQHSNHPDNWSMVSSASLHLLKCFTPPLLVCSKDIKVAGVLGPASALEKKSPLVSEQVRLACDLEQVEIPPHGFIGSDGLGHRWRQHASRRS